VRLITPPGRPCPYLPDQIATLRAFYVDRMAGATYHDFLDAGFRRAGHVIYQPACTGCRACQSLRVPAAEFSPGKSLRRCWRRNADLIVEAGPPILTDEKHDLYRRYLAARHDRAMDDDPDSLREFLYDSPVETIEFTYRDGSGQLLAVGIWDVCRRSISSVYFYFDPDHERRGLGNYGVMAEIDYARREKIPHWYAGFWVKGCRAMEYKANFRPHELLGTDGAWHVAE